MGIRAVSKDVSPGRDDDKAALRGEASYVWRDGQQRRLDMISAGAAQRMHGQVLENGCGVGLYVEKMAALGAQVFGMELDFIRAREAAGRSDQIVSAAGENLPYPNDSFDAVLSHEVIEHVQDDHKAVAEMVRALKPGGRIILFCPNRWYPFETHGIYWRGRYRFGNIPLVNYLPRFWRDKLAPHVKAYSRKDLNNLFAGLPVRFVERKVIFGAYDNIIARWPGPGRALRAALQLLERTPLKALGLSHYWVIEKK
ncbi:MAG: class I SAM-dependent methyltransferase [Anaerolineae bacterium]|nr:class I SAM-dependent methyltransferase [Anaerolineae bacterium]